jgi:hypothetical protein
MAIALAIILPLAFGIAFAAIRLNSARRRHT